MIIVVNDYLKKFFIANIYDTYGMPNGWGPCSGVEQSSIEFMIRSGFEQIPIPELPPEERDRLLRIYFRRFYKSEYDNNTDTHTSILIEMIKRCREITGWNLGYSKRFIESEWSSFIEYFNSCAENRDKDKSKDNNKQLQETVCDLLKL